jgi:hypothetical protein
VDEHTIPPAGDPFTTKTPSDHEHLAKLEESYRHELMYDEQRLELRDRIIRIRRRVLVPHDDL